LVGTGQRLGVFGELDFGAPACRNSRKQARNYHRLKEDKCDAAPNGIFVGLVERTGAVQDDAMSRKLRLGDSPPRDFIEVKHELALFVGFHGDVSGAHPLQDSQG
jgi:hypothetical protein